MEAPDSDVWIELAELNTGLPPKYFRALAFPTLDPYGIGSSAYTSVTVKFNLTAYVRDMIAEAVK